MTALDAWTEQLAAWAIPEHIVAAAPESPWVLPKAVFTRRADRYVGSPVGASYEELHKALQDKGTVLDIGAGAGAASLPAAEFITHLTAVDANEDLLAEFAQRATALGVEHELVHGCWPEVAGDVDPADVVICANVLYNVPDLRPFAEALTGWARRRVIVELADAHPLTSINALWKHFHGIDRPLGPTAEDAAAALRELGIEPEVARWRRPAMAEYRRFGELVDVTRRRLCLPPEAADDVAEALRGQGIDAGNPPDLGSSGREVVTLSWSGSPKRGS
ncbi:Methyltransferase domain-containing protein [Amycolatopsis xylanica]|uniref:Methyltransferase domain-containing protein n=1 Tax=Amycolatopsis xylanica TaxID=589385 RepID=A0A1H2YSE2_9PSEU|nr:class I SAM-dependent methyltransferase [Amycolatopsis xylanica]SDX08076.1 Methyltransferase domain-containing protein [Amycolatopsis xylanica]